MAGTVPAGATGVESERREVSIDALLVTAQAGGKQIDQATKLAQDYQNVPGGQDRGVVLVVDDSPTVRKLVTITLEKRDYRVIPAGDGLEALAKISDGLPDLILLDITMPRMDGYQLCKIIKGNPGTKHVPVVMLSGKDGFFDKVRGRMAGSTEYITKPFKPDALVETVEKHIARKHVA